MRTNESKAVFSNRRKRHKLGVGNITVTLHLFIQIPELTLCVSCTTQGANGTQWKKD
jgi:hypothetical protein